LAHPVFSSGKCENSKQPLRNECEDSYSTLSLRSVSWYFSASDDVPPNDWTVLWSFSAGKTIGLLPASDCAEELLPFSCLQYNTIQYKFTSTSTNKKVYKSTNKKYSLVINNISAVFNFYSSICCFVWGYFVL